IVSGLVTSPCDQLRIFSGDARLMRIASKSAIGFAMSKGLERYKVILRCVRRCAAACGSLQFSVPGSQLNSGSDLFSLCRAENGSSKASFSQSLPDLFARDSAPALRTGS